MQLTLFDVVAIAVVLLSALAALLRGFVREVLGVGQRFLGFDGQLVQLHK